MAAGKDRTMQALRMSKQDEKVNISIDQISIPVPQPGELLIKIRASAIQPADILNSQGRFPHTTLSRTLGRDFAGVVVAGSSSWQGSHVFGTSGHDFSFTVDGAQAEYAVVPEDAVIRMPNNLSFAQAAILGTPWSTAALTLIRSRAERGETAMILGATGSVGGAAVQIAKRKGMKLITVGRHGTDVNSVSDPTLAKALEMTAGNGVDVVVDTVGDTALMSAALNVMAEYGRLAIISAPRTGDTHPSVDMFAFYRKQLSIVGCNSVDTPQSVLASALRDLVDGFESGELIAPDEHIWTEIKLDQALDAYAGKIKHAIVMFDE